MATLSPLWGGALIICLFVEDANWTDRFAGTAIILSTAASWRFAKITAHHMAIENMSFKMAAKYTFYPVLMKLSFIPGAGPLFERFLKPKNRNPFLEKTEPTDALPEH
ncbi:MAG: hypothetical protein LBI02_09275 [Opitutaceae bacterium]|jgi:hypothetical protein|nr:hypothetical protein [Opitutaceae bacterium]